MLLGESKTSVAESENLAGFTARLVGLGISQPELGVCILMFFRIALETPRRILDNDECMSGDHENIEAPLSTFLPALVAWLRHGSHKIFSFCAQGYIPEDSANSNEECASAGPLIEEQLQGFNMSRWQFWKDRFTEVHHSADEEVAEQSRICARLMESWELITGGKRHERSIARQAHFRLT